MRLVDIDDAIEKAIESDKAVGSGIWETSEVVEYLEGLPTVDAVEVVCCADCVLEGTENCPMVHRDPMLGNLYCTFPANGGYCSYGERRDKDGRRGNG